MANADDCDDADASLITRSWYADADDDGFGAGEAISACVAPDGAVTTAGDCDDADPTVFPAAPEFCDAVDQDCDGDATNDAIDGFVYYADADVSTPTNAPPSVRMHRGVARERVLRRGRPGVSHRGASVGLWRCLCASERPGERAGAARGAAPHRQTPKTRRPPARVHGKATLDPAFPELGDIHPDFARARRCARQTPRHPYGCTHE